MNIRRSIVSALSEPDAFISINANNNNNCYYFYINNDTSIIGEPLEGKNAGSFLKVYVYLLGTERIML